MRQECMYLRNNKKLKVYVGLSGGVDSAVSAALLKKAGYGVTGVFIKVWQPDWIECSWKEDRREAMRVAAHLDIPFITLDLEKEYKEGVIDYMIAEYAAGRTPNPDVMCNREVKFGAFWKWAKNNGADFIATGHYCKIKDQKLVLGHDRGSKIKNKNTEKQIVLSENKLLMGRDPNKDQSYFLWTLKQTDLEHVLFPVGDIPKPEVRNLAQKFKLPNANRKDSQGLCFIGKVDVKKFLTHYIKTQAGDVLDEFGKKIGNHPGALLFTIGERHGFEITKKTPHDMPYYVFNKNIEKNTLTVTNKTNNKSSNKNCAEVTISNCNWINKVPEVGLKLKARSRYRQELFGVTFRNIENNQAVLDFDVPQETITPGQSLVIYDDEECLGGGIIV